MLTGVGPIDVNCTWNKVLPSGNITCCDTDSQYINLKPNYQQSAFGTVFFFYFAGSSSVDMGMIARLNDQCMISYLRTYFSLDILAVDQVLETPLCLHEMITIYRYWSSILSPPLPPKHG